MLKKAKKFTEEKIKNFVVNMYKEGSNIDLIVKLTNVSKKTIENWFKEEGLI